MNNDDIFDRLSLTAKLLELHGANDFKVRAYTSTVFNLEKISEPLADQTVEQLVALGFSKNMAEKVAEIARTGSFAELDDLLAQTPEGVVSMLDIKGIGPKKVRVIWQELQVTTIEQLREACEQGKVAQLKGFGDKTQQAILEQLAFKAQNVGKLHFAQAEPLALQLLDYLAGKLPNAHLSAVGQLRRQMETVELLEILVGGASMRILREVLTGFPALAYDEPASGPFTWRGAWKAHSLPVAIHWAPAERFASENVLLTGAPAHLAAPVAEGQTLRQLAALRDFPSENDLYQAAGWAYVAPELREGWFELALAKEQNMPRLVEMTDLKGILHNHSTWSDGKHSLEEMARYCQALGYEYLGITDHSQAASYANGLTVDRVRQQQAEIDRLNAELAPFRIFKGIESDILGDGSLDYPDEVLASFDFIVASIHSNLKMNQEKATQRLLTAIANPYTTILGHPTGRLLLRREGYPIDHRAVIDACAKHGVVIEINAHPWRLDLDWRWVRYALDQGVKISINPDAHEKDGYHDMRYGLLVGRKAGLTKEMTFNALTVAEIADWFAARRKT